MFYKLFKSYCYIWIIRAVAVLMKLYLIVFGYFFPFQQVTGIFLFLSINNDAMTP